MKNEFLFCSLFFSLMMLTACGANNSDTDNADLTDITTNSTANVISENVDLTSDVSIENYSLFDVWVLDGSVTEDSIGVIYTFNEDLTGTIYYSEDDQIRFVYTFDEAQGILGIEQEGCALNEFNYSLPDENRLCIGNMTFYRQ